MRTLYLPIIEPGAFHDTALRYKRGLRLALKARGAVYQWDYLATPERDRYQRMWDLIAEFQPDLILTQFHGADIITPEQIRLIRNAEPQITWVNWSGDSWLHSLTSEPMLAMCREIDLQLVAAPDVLPVYAQHGIRAAFWQIAYEPSITPLPEMPQYDLVFLGNVISDKRRRLLELLRSLEGISVGIYGDWEHADGHNTYHFGEGEMLYRLSWLTVADAAYVDQANYISNRPFQALAAGTLLLHERVEKMDVLSGLVAGVHYIDYTDLGELPALIKFWMQPAQAADRLKIVSAGQRFVLHYHTYEARVEQLLREYLPMIGKESATWMD